LHNWRQVVMAQINFSWLAKKVEWICLFAARPHQCVNHPLSDKALAVVDI